MYSDTLVCEQIVYKFLYCTYGMEKLVTVVQFASQLYAYASPFLLQTDCCSRCRFVAITPEIFLSVQNVMAFLNSRCGSSSIAACSVALLWGSLFLVLS